MFASGAEEGIIRDYETDAQNRVNFLLSWIQPGLVLLAAVGALVGLLHLVLPERWHWLNEAQRLLAWLLLGGGTITLRGYIRTKNPDSRDVAG